MSERPTVVYLTEVVFSSHMCNAFGVKLLCEHGYNVELWNISAALHAGYDRQYTTSEPDHLFSRAVSFSSMAEISRAIQNSSPETVFILFMWYRLETWSIFRALSRSNRIYGTQLQNSQPSSGYTRQPLFRTIRKILSKPRLLLDKLFALTPLHKLGVRHADFFIAGGRASAANRLIGPQTRIIWTSANDYSIFLDERNSPERTIADNRYLVFLDEYWPYHEDWVLIGTSAPITPEKYYPRMCELFDHAEELFGCPVVIAAHPRSNYEDKPGLYGNRRVIKGKTANLVKDAWCVIAHDSLSINLANLFEKPVIFTKFTFDPSFDGEVVPDAMAEAFGKKAINLDLVDSVREIDLKAELSIDHDAYHRYRNDYIVTDQALGRKNWAIVLDFLNSLPGATTGDNGATKTL